MRQAIFVMRDRVICEEQPGCILTGAAPRFVPGAVEALRILTRLDMPIVLLVDWAGISQSAAAAQALAWRHERLIEAISAQGGRCDAIFACPHGPQEACACHMPHTGLLSQAALRLAIDLSRSALICDTWEHSLAALGARCQPVLTLTERGRSELFYPMWAQVRERIWYAADVVGAAQSIEATVQGQRLWRSLHNAQADARDLAQGVAQNVPSLGQPGQ